MSILLTYTSKKNTPSPSSFAYNKKIFKIFVRFVGKTPIKPGSNITKALGPGVPKTPASSLSHGNNGNKPIPQSTPSTTNASTSSSNTSNSTSYNSGKSIHDADYKWGKTWYDKATLKHQHDHALAKAKEAKVEQQAIGQTMPTNKFDLLKEKGVLHDTPQGVTQLTPQARDLYRITQPKIQLRNRMQNINDTTENVGDTNSKKDDSNNSEDFYVAGSVVVNEETTEFLTPIQSHIVVGSLNPDTNFVEAHLLYTSDKGNHTGLAGMSYTEKVADKQVYPNTAHPNKAQYVRSIIPPVTIHPADFNEDDIATEYTNQPDIKKKLEPLVASSKRFEPIPYNRTGVSMNDLEQLADMMGPSDSKQNNSNTNKDETTATD